MGMWIGRNRKARVTYGFDEIALVPGAVTINPNEVDITWKIPRPDGGAIKFALPVLASAMDGVVDARFAAAMGKLGGLAVLNLEGVQVRYENADAVLAVLALPRRPVPQRDDDGSRGSCPRRTGSRCWRLEA